MSDKTIGEYKVIKPLGEGGFGIVYQARSSAPKSPLVAIKVLNREALGNEKVVKKFFHEAMILARLDHPNITRLFEFFPDREAYAIVMEYVEGVSLRELLSSQRGVLPFDRAMDICRQILAAFQYAHENGIIHRDIKPGNIMINPKGQVKIMDFGIAKYSSVASSETKTTWRWGAPHYMAPERFHQDGAIDMRSDIYSLGVVFYEIFTGHKPFESSDTIRVIYCHINELPKPFDNYIQGLPEHVSNAIFKALEKDPEKRFTSCRQFLLAMEGKDPGDVPDPLPKRANHEDATLIVGDELAAALAASRDGSQSWTSRVKAGLSKNYRYLVGLSILLVVLAVGLAVEKNFLVFKRDAGGQADVAAISGHRTNSSGHQEARHPLDKKIMVLIPGSEFTMGSDRYDDEKPVQRVNLSAFYIDRTPVTRKEFARFVSETNYVTDAEKDGAAFVRMNRKWEKTPGASWKMPDGKTDPGGDGDNLPVTQVSHNDAAAYCAWAGKELPTEARWEKAARGIDGGVYPWGDQVPENSFAHFDDPKGQPVAVGKFGQKSHSPYGVSDMAGNVSQWCSDWYAPAVREYRDPRGPASGTERVVKGGAFVEGPDSLRSSSRDHYAPNFASNLIGFRCACEKLGQ
ncbi:MAG: SUMF1/EgtB/PvdO family nonheme iron enzyme [Deltaproteobacteria bacterium]|nr:SUMF1/EgtB/PvdO family nonheme iron enzyme [Deltaproteobacteria bacterium]